MLLPLALLGWSAAFAQTPALQELLRGAGAGELPAVSAPVCRLRVTLDAHRHFTDSLWPFALEGAGFKRPEVLERCLALPGMIGIKLHFRWFHQRLSSPETAARLESLATTMDRKRWTFLIHMNLEKDAAGELSALREVARRHPRSRFVIAHAAESALDALAASGGVENLYTEVSTFVIRDPAELAAALRGFGIGRVLFGVDGPGYGSKRTIERFLALPLTDAEKTAVLETNGAAFWEATSH